jgi:hypothetical protein
MQIEWYTSMLPWLSLGTLLIYVPFICYLDWKYRDIGTHAIWLPLLAVNIPVVSAAYLTGYYPPVLLFLTSMISLAWFLIFYRKGADCAWLILITMFAVVHPVTGVALLYPFLMYLAIFTAAAIWWVFLDNRVRKGMWAFDIENGIPYLIPISLALIAAVVM